MRRFLLRALAFVLVLLALYALTLFALANAPAAVQTRVRSRFGIPVGLYDVGADTALRFRELEHVGRVDLLFVGSSHTARGFDTRIFAANGFRAFNIGSSNQTPLNSYFLLRRHIARLQPRHVVLEVYFRALSVDGVESTVDLSANTSLTPDVFQMALATSSMTSVNAFLLQLFDVRRSGRRRQPPMLAAEDRYIPGGFVERDPSKAPT